ncbi:MAG: type IV secretory system conjugative DNA transfer family protein [Kurthia sp.]|nr:type IV secretory system conjugative DNA transfer family protein [Candidatus Kurthia equi]
MRIIKRRGENPLAPAPKGEITIERDGFFNYRFESAIKKTKREEFIRMTLNYKLVTVLTYFNVGVLFPIALINWVLTLLGFFDFAILNFLPWWLFIMLWALPYITWQYSTITIPQKEGPRIVKDWSKTEKGRKRAAFMNLTPIHVMGWCAGAKFVFDYYLDYLTSIRLHEPYKNIILADDLDTFILVLFVVPVIFSALMMFIQARDYMINKDLLKTHFLTWEAPHFTKYAHEYVLESCDVIVGFEIDTKKPIVIKEDARFLHEAIIGATGSGKTSTTLLLRIAQDLVKIASGVRECGLVFLEPKGDGVDDVLTLCKKLGIPDEKIMVIDPTKSWSMKYNPFDGNREAAAASFQGTLSALAGDQDQFFKDQQNEAANMYALLAKIRYGQQTNILHIQEMFSDPRYLADVVETVRGIIERSKERTDITTEMRNELEAYNRVVSYFENDVLDYKTFRDKEEIKPVLYPMGHKYQGKQMVENKKDKFITGAKKYLNDIAQNTLLQSLFVSAEGEQPFNADEFLKNGGIVLVNTALGELDELSLLFGQFFIRNFQSAVFRRAKEDKKAGVKRIPIYFYVDEFPLYANEAFERFLTLGRSFKVGAVIAMQSIAQLDAVGLAYRKSVMGNASHKTVFGRGPVEDNEYFSKEFGEELRVEESLNESGTPMSNDKQSWGYRINTQKKLMPRFTPTDIRELPFKQMIVQVVNERNSIAIPKLAVGQFVHESPFVQRFMSLVESDIKSTYEDELVYSEHLSKEQLEVFSRNVTEDYVTYKAENHDTYESEPQQTVKDELSVDQVLDVTDAHSVITNDVMDTLKSLQDSVHAANSEQVEQIEANKPLEPLPISAVPKNAPDNSAEMKMPIPTESAAMPTSDDEWSNMILGSSEDPTDGMTLPIDESTSGEPIQWEENELLGTLSNDTTSSNVPVFETTTDYEIPILPEDVVNAIAPQIDQVAQTPPAPLIVSNSSDAIQPNASGQYSLDFDLSANANALPIYEAPSISEVTTRSQEQIEMPMQPSNEREEEQRVPIEETVVAVPKIEVEHVVEHVIEQPASQNTEPPRQKAVEKKSNVIPLPVSQPIDPRYKVKEEIFDDEI